MWRFKGSYPNAPRRTQSSFAKCACQTFRAKSSSLSDRLACWLSISSVSPIWMWQSRRERITLVPRVTTTTPVSYISSTAVFPRMCYIPHPHVFSPCRGYLPLSPPLDYPCLLSHASTTKHWAYNTPRSPSVLLRKIKCTSFLIEATGLDLRDAADAHVVFEAVRLRLLPLIKRRLTSEEREQLASGNIFVWEEAEHKGGLERWTDGRRW